LNPEGTKRERKEGRNGQREKGRKGGKEKREERREGGREERPIFFISKNTIFEDLDIDERLVSSFYVTLSCAHLLINLEPSLY
jgi:hypothetical protein